MTPLLGSIGRGEVTEILDGGRRRRPSITQIEAGLELRDGTFEFVDDFQGRRAGHQRLFPSATVIGDKRVPPRV